MSTAVEKRKTVQVDLEGKPVEEPTVRWCPFMDKPCRKDCELFVVYRHPITGEVVGTGCVLRALLYLESLRPNR